MRNSINLCTIRMIRLNIVFVEHETPAGETNMRRTMLPEIGLRTFSSVLSM